MLKKNVFILRKFTNLSKINSLKKISKQKILNYNVTLPLLNSLSRKFHLTSYKSFSFSFTLNAYSKEISLNVSQNKQGTLSSIFLSDLSNTIKLHNLFSPPFLISIEMVYGELEGLMTGQLPNHKDLNLRQTMLA